MELEEAIRGRRSIRKYRHEEIPENLLKKILEAGMDAPSAGNLQSRHFYIVRNLALRRSLVSAAKGQGFIAEAPVAIVICEDLRIDARYGERGSNLYAIMDCAASIQNMMLMAHSLGLGTCWVGKFDEREAAKIVGAPAYFRAVSILSLGYPAESPKPPQRVKFEDACEFL